MYKFTKYSYEEFILRLKQIENKKNERQLALAMDLRPDTFAQMKIRNRLPFETIIGYCEKTGYSLDRLFFDVDNNDKSLGNSVNSINIHENNKNFHNYRIYNSNEYVRLPTINNAHIYKALDYLNAIYIFDENVKEYIGASFYVIDNNQTSQNIVVAKILTKLDGGFAYQYVDSDTLQDISKSDLSKVKIIGRVVKTITL